MNADLFQRGSVRLDLVATTLVCRQGDILVLCIQLRVHACRCWKVQLLTVLQHGAGFTSGGFCNASTLVQTL